MITAANSKTAYLLGGVLDGKHARLRIVSCGDFEPVLAIVRRVRGISRERVWEAALAGISDPHDKFLTLCAGYAVVEIPAPPQTPSVHAV